MLDFLAPENVISVGKDLKIANDLVDKLISDLNINNYKVNLVKDENSEEMQYIITVNKKED